MLRVISFFALNHFGYPASPSPIQRWEGEDKVIRKYDEESSYE